MRKTHWMSQVGAPSRDWKIRMLAPLSAQQREVEGPCLLTADFQQCPGGEWVEKERFEDVLVTFLLL